MARLQCRILSTQYGVSNHLNDLKLEAVTYDHTGAVATRRQRRLNTSRFRKKFYPFFAQRSVGCTWLRPIDLAA